MAKLNKLAQIILGTNNGSLERRVALHSLHLRKWVKCQARYFGVPSHIMLRIIRFTNMCGPDNPQCLSHIMYAFRDSHLTRWERNKVIRSILERWLKKGYIKFQSKELDPDRYKVSSFIGFVTTDKGWWPTKEGIFEIPDSWDLDYSSRVDLTGGYYNNKVSRHLDKCLETKHLEEDPLLVYDPNIIPPQMEDIQHRLDNNISDYQYREYCSIGFVGELGITFRAKSPDDPRGRSYKSSHKQDVIGDKIKRQAVKSAISDPIDLDTVEPI